MKLLVGLGNPGDAYAQSRHNAGFLAIDRIAKEYGYRNFHHNFRGLCAYHHIGKHCVLLLKPLTYMNDSGVSVLAIARHYKITNENITVFHDEIDFPIGRIQVRSTGSLAGHRGLLSIRTHLGEGFQRVRIGIGRPEKTSQVKDHLLDNFGIGERAWLLDPLLERVAKSLPLLLDEENARFTTAVLARHTQSGKTPADRLTRQDPPQKETCP